MRKLIGLGLMLGLVAATPSAAVVVASSMPTGNNPDWTEVIFANTSMVHSGGVTTMTTANNRGVYFGRVGGTGSFDPVFPSWTLAPNASGNYMTVTARLSSGSDDWVAYLQDGSYGGFVYFNPTPCNPVTQNCYLETGAVGVSLQFATGTVFVPLDTTQFLTYEMLVKGSQVIYRINGRRYAGQALVTSSTNVLIGDNTGSSRSGTGSFSLNAVAFDRAPSFSDLPSSVPEPASWAMLVTGFGLAGMIARRRRTAKAAI